MSSRIYGVIVALDPPPGFAARMRNVSAQCDAIVIVDNGSFDAIQLHHIGTRGKEIHLLRNAQNVGLAKALNAGIERASKLGATHVVLIDHDSTVAPEMVDALHGVIEAASPDAEIVAVPTIIFSDNDNRCRWPQTSISNRIRFRLVYGHEIAKPTSVDLAVGSGMHMSVQTWKRLGGFDEQLFVDLVDTDFCLRARAAGMSIMAVPTARLLHDIGHPDRRDIPLLGPAFPTHHSDLRHYYIARNRVTLLQRHGPRFPSWVAYETLSGLKLTAKVLLFEPQRLQKLLSMVRGSKDGLSIALRRTCSDHSESPAPGSDL